MGNVEPIGVMYVKELLELVVVLFKDPHTVEQEMDKIVVAFLVKVVRLGHLVNYVIEMDFVLIVLEDRFFEELRCVVRFVCNCLLKVNKCIYFMLKLVEVTVNYMELFTL